MCSETGILVNEMLPLLFVDDFYLLTDAFLVDALEDMSHELRPHTAEGTLGTTLAENLVVARSLKNSHVVLTLVLANLAAHAHTLSQQFHELVVEFVDLLTQLVDALGCGVLVANDKERENVVEHVGSGSQ